MTDPRPRVPAPRAPTADADKPRPVRAINSGPGRVLVGLYGLFALSAGARAGVQIATKFHHAPLAYVLSAVSAAIYLVAMIALIRGGRVGRLVAIVCISVELVGVLAVGTLTLVDSSAFPDATVWSDFGRGYGFVPLVLPVLGLLWLRATPAPPR
jgi:hypothetical protein